jgi:hypothetical protein
LGYSGRTLCAEVQVSPSSRESMSEACRRQYASLAEGSAGRASVVGSAGQRGPALGERGLFSDQAF